MALINCPECRKSVSDKADACPHCGHPVSPQSVALPRVAAPKRSGCFGPLVAGLVVLVIVLVIIAAGSDDAAKPPPSACKSDWRSCSDNADMVNNYSGILAAQSACKLEASKRAKYGEPKWPWFSFGTFYKGDGYVKSGKPMLIERDAQFSNSFGAMAHSTVTCTYDLDQKKVLDVVISSN